MPTAKYEVYWERRKWQLGWYRGTRAFAPLVYSGDSYCAWPRREA